MHIYRAANTAAVHSDERNELAALGELRGARLTPSRDTRASLERLPREREVRGTRLPETPQPSLAHDPVAVPVIHVRVGGMTAPHRGDNRAGAPRRM